MVFDFSAASAMQSTRTEHFWQNFYFSVFSVFSCSISLVAACRAATLRENPQNLMRLLRRFEAILFSQSIVHVTELLVNGRKPTGFTQNMRVLEGLCKLALMAANRPARPSPGPPNQNPGQSEEAIVESTSGHSRRPESGLICLPKRP